MRRVSDSLAARERVATRECLPEPLAQSLGASRRQLLGQLLTESVVLAAIGGVVSIVVAHWTLNGIASLLPDEAAETMQFRLNWMTIAFAAGMSLVRRSGLLA